MTSNRPRALAGALLLGTLSLLVGGCAAAKRLNFADAERLCSSNRSECERRCTAGPKRSECDVMEVEYAESRQVRLANPQQMEALKSRLTKLCQQGIERSCSALANLPEPLQGTSSTVSRARRDRARRAGAGLTAAEKRYKELSKTYDADSRSIPFGRVREIQSARDAMSRLDPDSTGNVEAQLDGAERLLAEAEAELDRIDKARADRVAKREQQVADERAAIEAQRRLTAEHAAWRAAISKCGENLKGCEKECADRPDADECSGVAMTLFSGGTGIPKDRKKARKVASESCDAGATMACKTVKVIDAAEASEEAKAKAERELPGLFAKCNEYRLKIKQLKAARDIDGLKKLEPDWAKNADDIAAAIALLEEGRDERRVDLLRKFQACSGGK